MMEELLKQLKVKRQELDPDIVCDYNFIMGDMNYRFDMSYDDMILNDKIKIATDLIDEYDQLHISMNRKKEELRGVVQHVTSKYPNYYEDKITFKPTYKRNFDDQYYKNKKNQAPSYCDRILFKNNTVYPFTVNKYDCLDNVFGSDHRPVYLSLSIKQAHREDIKQQQQEVNIPAVSDINEQVKRIMQYSPRSKYIDLNLSQIMQSYGMLSMKFVRITSLKLPSAISNLLATNLKKQMASLKGVVPTLQHFQISFYSEYISDFESSNEITTRFMDGEQTPSSLIELCWEEKEMPKMYTPINNVDILQNKRLILVLWYLDEFTQTYQTIGQVNIPICGFINVGNDISQMAQQSMDLTLANEVVGKVDFKMIFQVTTTRGNSKQEMI